jgi:hypothetical protein
MPNSLINKASKETGKSKKELEKLWEKSKKTIKKQNPEVIGTDKYYKYVVTLFKKMSGYNPKEK